jgi:hypothetical protein
MYAVEEKKDKQMNQDESEFGFYLYFFTYSSY